MQAVAVEARVPEPSTGGALLSELQAAHADLTLAIAAMARVTARPMIDIGDYTRVRWHLTRASRARRRVIERALDALAHRAAPADAALLRRLRADDIAAVRNSSAHIYKWPLEAVKADWSGYGRASALIRSRMRQRIEEEQAHLVPLLARY